MQWYSPIIEICDRKWWWSIIKTDCPIKRHLKGIMVVEGDEEEEGAHVYPITCAKLLNGKKF